MWHLIQHFFEHNVIVKAFVIVGWLAIIIMALSLFSPMLS